VRRWATSSVTRPSSISPRRARARPCPPTSKRRVPNQSSGAQTKDGGGSWLWRQRRAAATSLVTFQSGDYAVTRWREEGEEEEEEETSGRGRSLQGT